MSKVAEGALGELWTIGYGTRRPEEFLSILARHSIRFLIDVRSRPYSRYQPRFSREPLKELLVSCNITYGFMGDLLGGQPEDRELYSDGRVDYRKIWQTRSFAVGVARLLDGVRNGHRIAIMCSEARPENCHRSKMIAPALVTGGALVSHISEDGRLISQQDVISRLSSEQLNAFESRESIAEMSRKKYFKGP
jgi:uncharacterized protein (DUF488 family)